MFHEMRLKPEPFDRIVAGTKKISSDFGMKNDSLLIREIRLYLQIQIPEKLYQHVWRRCIWQVHLRN